MPSIKRTLLILFVLTMGAFALAWIHFINEGKQLDKDRFKVDSLKVLAYPTFVSVFGPGPELAQKFQERCKCKVELLNVGDSALFIEKLLAKGDDYSVDVVIGLDQLLIPAAIEKLKWKSLDIKTEGLNEKLKFPNQTYFWPLDWAPLTFMYKKSQIKPPTQISDLLEPRFKKLVSLQNPMTSTPGRHFFSWIYDNLGPEEGLKFFEKLNAQDFMFADNWSNSYGLFQKGTMKMSYTYLTSAVFHWRTEKQEDYQPAQLKEPLPIQVEYMAVPANCRMCKEAQEFIEFLHEEESQRAIMNENYMFPVIQGLGEEDHFEGLPQVQTLPLQSKMTEEWLKEALTKVSQ